MCVILYLMSRYMRPEGAIIVLCSFSSFSGAVFPWAVAGGRRLERPTMTAGRRIFAEERWTGMGSGHVHKPFRQIQSGRHVVG